MNDLRGPCEAGNEYHYMTGNEHHYMTGNEYHCMTGNEYHYRDLPLVVELNPFPSIFGKKPSSVMVRHYFHPNTNC